MEKLNEDEDEKYAVEESSRERAAYLHAVNRNHIFSSLEPPPPWEAPKPSTPTPTAAPAATEATAAESTSPSTTFTTAASNLRHNALHFSRVKLGSVPARPNASSPSPLEDELVHDDHQNDADDDGCPYPRYFIR